MLGLLIRPFPSRIPGDSGNAGTLGHSRLRSVGSAASFGFIRAPWTAGRSLARIGSRRLLAFAEAGRAEPLFRGRNGARRCRRGTRAAGIYSGPLARSIDRAVGCQIARGKLHTGAVRAGYRLANRAIGSGTEFLHGENAI